MAIELLFKCLNLTNINHRVCIVFTSSSIIIFINLIVYQYQYIACLCYVHTLRRDK